MRLSEAIRLGATMKPQGYGAFSHGGRTCALGAANDAVPSDIALSITFPILNQAGHCPECPMRDEDIFSVIAHLNDWHRWTRERIADFVELHEPLPEPETECTPAHPTAQEER